MSRIFWDSNLFIYFFEGKGERSEITRRLRKSMIERGDQLFTSALTIAEILVKPMAQGELGLCQQYEDLLEKTAVVVPFGVKAARRYAAIRSSASIKSPDAIQLACAGEAGVDLFVTNDNHLKGRKIEGIQFIVALDNVPI